MTIRIVVCDDEQLIREALGRLIAAAPDLEIVGLAANGGEAMDLCAQHAPDVVLMDIRMPGMDGIEATRRILRNPQPPAVLMLTTYDLDSYVHAALGAGARGFLLKDAPTERLRDGIRVVAGGQAVLAPEATARMIESLRPSLPTQQDRALTARAAALTDRERQVCDLLCEGLTNNEIAHRLRISRFTVKVHVSNVLAKLALADRVQVVLAWPRIRSQAG